ncbi:sodium/glutamate symporter [Caloramator proteoclasticus]|uniref:Sodium/glutamate symporter n=1 Tax=Caloramator proteoclasticus DSM 10124 TaxID=1121262 RepID=A0A1M4VCB6_9CLOT|nr:sodium/glutamate symporter [Caloramator proteoclasticus]SHE66508.1 glutamate:Na+ symporter, ESS family [Caloramator proteoclasticus DSM 10124]
MELKLDMIQTVGLAVVVYYLGVYIRSKVKVLEKFCIPAPVVGGLLFAIVNLILRENGILKLTLDTTLQKPFMLVFFTTIGLTASLKLLKKGGLAVLVFFLCTVVLVLLQDTLGVLVAKAVGANPLLGLIAGSVTMVGGHGTGAAFGELFEKSYGFNGAVTAAMAAATFGLVMGSLIGGPIGRKLIVKNNLKSHASDYLDEVAITTDVVNYEEMFKTFTVIIISMSLGAVLELWFKSKNITLPSYINAMIIAAIILNIGESTGKYHINQKCADILGSIGLNVFLSMALIGLKLWELKEVAGPMLAILIVQTILMALFAYFIVFRFNGKDYDAAVMAAGTCGFGMGATPNAMANMTAISEKYGPAPKAFFVIPIVGAFLIDFTNSIIITTFANFIK